MTNPALSVAAKESSLSREAVGCGMLLQDLTFSIPAYLVLIAPALTAVLSDRLSPLAYIALQFVDRLAELTFFFAVATLWRRRLSLQPAPINWKYALGYFATGIFLWLVLRLPLLSDLYPMPPPLQIACMVLVIPAIILNLKYFFFWTAFLFPQSSWKSALKFVGEFTDRDRLVALKILLGPAAIWILVSNILGCFSPDERHFVVALLSAFTSGIFWMLVTYLSLAEVFIQLSDSEWRAHSLDPYRQARLTTLEIQGPRWFAKCLPPKKAVGLLAISLLLWAGNFMRAADLPPAAKLSVISTLTQDHSVIVTLKADDPEYRFRGFRPVYFALAGMQRGLVAQYPKDAALVGSDENVLLNVPHGDSLTLRLEFQTSRSAEEIVKLEDLHLWYRNARLVKLEAKER